ncbi:MAG: SpoIID/LytB domain-containing protein [Flavobacteriales bacterium]|nr:SpoIID/LytB domain-containing protein [Flavobacteriales bacterium]
MLRNLVLLVALAGHAMQAFPQAMERTLRIGLLRDQRVKQVLVMSTRGSCRVLADGEPKGELKSTDGLRLEAAGTVITAKSLAMSFTASRIELVPYGDGGIKVKPDGSKNGREYAGRLIAGVVGGRMMLVNEVPIEAYVAGVVSAEAGPDQHMEYYKLQSVSCRTYALTNQRKHAEEGFDLCDGVHCQVHHGRNRNALIAAATEATRGLVIVDAQIKLIHATFHSNCGGETMNAEDLWSKQETYLRAVRDTFCLRAPHANWEKRLTRAEWLGYLDRRFGFVASDSSQLHAALNFAPQCRSQYLQGTWPLVHLKHVREDLKLRSTFFTVSPDGDHVLLRGRGFGHAVGLCQEGAMNMARAGFSYTDILHHYYASVHLIDLGTLDFFRDEGDTLKVGGAGTQQP